MGFIHGQVIRASMRWLTGSIMDAEEVRAREHEVAQDNLSKVKKGGDQDEVELRWFGKPRQKTVRR